MGELKNSFPHFHHSTEAGYSRLLRSLPFYFCLSAQINKIKDQIKLIVFGKENKPEGLCYIKIDVRK